MVSLVGPAVMLGSTRSRGGMVFTTIQKFMPEEKGEKAQPYRGSATS